MSHTGLLYLSREGYACGWSPTDRGHRVFGKGRAAHCDFTSRSRADFQGFQAPKPILVARSRARWLSAWRHLFDFIEDGFLERCWRRWRFAWTSWRWWREWLWRLWRWTRPTRWRSWTWFLCRLVLDKPRRWWPWTSWTRSQRWLPGPWLYLEQTEKG